MSAENLQERVDRLGAGEKLKLDPPRKEFKGPLVIRKPAIIDGQGGTICAATGPIVKIEAPGVVLSDLNVEITSREAPLEGEGACALVVQPPVGVTLRNVAVRGNVSGLEDEEGVWRCPASLPLRTLRAGVPHDFKVELITPVACTLESEIAGLSVQPSELPGGPVTVTLHLEALPANTRLRGLLLLRTRQLLRRIAVNGHLSDTGALGVGDFLWRPTGPVAPPAEIPSMPMPPPALADAPRTTPLSQSTRPVERPREPTGHEALVVSAFEEGAYRTLGEALQHARTGGRVLVRPGMYKESLTLPKTVEIVGDGPVGEIILESPDGNCLVMQADLARVRGLTLRCAAGSSNRERYAVHVPHGQLILEDCHITSDSLACLAATGASAAPTLRRCKIHGGASAGVLVLDKATAVLEDCDLAEHALAGVECRRGGHASLRNCRVLTCAQAGVLAHDGGKATLDECDLDDNAVAGVECRENGQVSLRRCRVHNGRGPGVRVHLGAQASLEDCDLYENALANLEVGSRGNPHLRRCRLRQGKQAGALFGPDAQGVLEDCELYGNARAAVEIRQNANPTLRRCSVRECGDVGVTVRDRGRGTLENCDLAEAELAVVDIRQSGAPVLKHCKIHDGRRAGVLAAARGGGTLEDCEILANRGPGVAICGDGNPALKRCQVRDNGQAGVVSWDNGRGTLEECEISSNGLAGLVILASGSPTARGCRIIRNNDVGVWARRKAEGAVEDCDLTGNREGSLELESGGNLRLVNARMD
jgi:parallel beta-helix repeat protein